MMALTGPGVQTLGVPAQSRDPLAGFHPASLAGLWPPLPGTSGLRHPALCSQRRYVPHILLRSGAAWAVTLATGLPPRSAGLCAYRGESDHAV